MRLKTLLAALALGLAACSPATSDAASGAAKAARHPVSGLAVIPLTVTHAGKVHRFRVEVARSRDEQMRGLMFRTEMGADEGMIFPMDPPRMASFWMKNTVLPLDIVFIGRDRRIVNIAANTVPYSLDSVQSADLVSAVLELNAGRAAALGIAAGDTVRW